MEGNIKKERRKVGGTNGKEKKEIELREGERNGEPKQGAVATDCVN